MPKLNKYALSNSADNRAGNFGVFSPFFRFATGATIIAVAILIAYSPSVNGKFVFDDDLLLTNNGIIMAPDGLYRFWFTADAYDYWPVSNSSLWIEWRLWNMNSTGYHVTNLALHLVDTLLIWIVLRKLSIPGAFLAALIFAVHPVNVESVAWISQRKNLLAMFFFLLSVLCYLKHLLPGLGGEARTYRLAPFSDRWYVLAFVTFILAMLSKGSVAMQPAALLLITWWLRPLKKSDFIRILPFFAAAVGLAALNVWFQTHGLEDEFQNVGMGQRLLGAGGVVWFYLYKAIFPLELLFVYPQWSIGIDKVAWWLPLAAILILTAILWFYKNTWSRSFLFAWGFFCIALTPALGITRVGFMKYSLVANHYQHIALIGAIALVSAGWKLWNKKEAKPLFASSIVVAVVAVGLLEISTYRQNTFYTDATTMYKHILEKNPDSWMAHNNLGRELAAKGYLAQAKEHFQKALTLHGRYSEAYNNMGNLLLYEGKLSEAIEYYQQAIKYRSIYPEAYNNMGNALLRGGNLSESIEQYEIALKLQQNYPSAHYNLGNALVKSNRVEEAIKHYHSAISIKKDYPEAYNNLGNALLQVGNLPGAIENFSHALSLEPRFTDARFNLAVALAKAGKHQEAAERLVEVLQLNPDNMNAYLALISVYVKLGQSSEALATAQRALEIAKHTGQSDASSKLEKWLKSNSAVTPK